MLDSENIPGNNKTLEISIGTITILGQNLEMLKFVPDQLNAKKFVKMQSKS